jgi:predicted transcriptional regulator
LLAFNSKDWAYSTVKTIMDRMANKGYLKIQKIRNLQLFSSAISEVDAKRGESCKMLKRAFDGALPPMIQFLIKHDELSEQEYRQLERLIKNRKLRKFTPRERK